MIDRILDKYYTKKLIEFIKSALVMYILDKKFEVTKDRVKIFIKKDKYNDNEYTLIGTFLKKDALEYLCNQNEVILNLRKKAKEYCEER